AAGICNKAWINVTINCNEILPTPFIKLLYNVLLDKKMKYNNNKPSKVESGNIELFSQNLYTMGEINIIIIPPAIRMSHNLFSLSILFLIQSISPLAYASVEADHKGFKNALKKTKSIFKYLK